MWIKTTAGLFNFETNWSITLEEIQRGDGFFSVWFQNEKGAVAAKFSTVRGAKYFLYQLGEMLGAKS